MLRLEVLGDDRAAAAARLPVLEALVNLDDEGFAFLVSSAWQISRSAGGFHDKIGFRRLRAACAAYLQIEDDVP